MSDIPENLRFARSHEWVRHNDDGTVTVGISDHAQQSLGDLVYVELPATGTTFAAGEACAVVESVKAASDVYCPINGEVIAVNDALGDAPELVNQEPYGQGWLLTMLSDDPGEHLLAAADYAKVAAAAEG